MSALGPGTISYQWIKDGKIVTKTNLPNITGVNSCTLYISELCDEHDGQYFCTISNESCMLVTDCAVIQGMHYNRHIIMLHSFIVMHDMAHYCLYHACTFSLCICLYYLGREPLKILKHPLTQCTTYNKKVTLSVSATGAGTLYYQWMKDKQAIGSDTPLPDCTGLDTSTLLISSFAEEHEGSYTCVVKNDDNTLESSSADLKGKIRFSMTCMFTAIILWFQHSL